MRRWRWWLRPKEIAPGVFATGEPVHVDELETLRLRIREHVGRLLSASEPVTWAVVIASCEVLWRDAGVEGPYGSPNVPLVMVEQAALGDADTRRLRRALEDAVAALSFASGRIADERDRRIVCSTWEQARRSIEGTS